MIGASPSNLLSQLMNILDSDPYIDEVGFIHPSQFTSLNEGALSQLGEEINVTKSQGASSFDTCFWHREHKLGISTLIVVPLYKAAKDAFMNSLKRYKELSDSVVQKDEFIDNNGSMSLESCSDNVERELMKHSKALVLLSCDFGTAWNFRKLVLSKKQILQMFMDELLLSTLVLSHSPKSERAWSHRRSVIKMIAGKCPNLQEILERESELVKTIAENSKMNYRAWNHRCWLVSYMLHSQVLRELQNSRDWAGLHVADNSCFHYRAHLLLRISEDLQNNHASDTSTHAEVHQMLKDELDWVLVLIQRYVGREALWLHRRFLSLLWMKQFQSSEINNFIANELKLFSSCTIIPDNDFGDYEAQATHSATYILWLSKQMPASFGVELRRSSQYEEIKSLLNKVGKSCIWDSFTASFKEV